LKKDYQILIIFGMNIPDITGHQMTIEAPTSPSVCFCNTWGKWTHKMRVEMNQKRQNNIPDIIDCNLKKDDPIVTVFGRGILDITGQNQRP